MTKTEKTPATKSKLPILVGAIGTPLLFNGLILVTVPDLFMGADGRLDTQFLLLSIVIPLIFGAIVGVVSRLIAKSQRGGILIAVIVNALAVVACLLSGPLLFLALVAFLGYVNP